MILDKWCTLKHAAHLHSRRFEGKCVRYHHHLLLSRFPSARAASSGDVLSQHQRHTGRKNKASDKQRWAYNATGTLTIIQRTSLEYAGGNFSELVLALLLRKKVNGQERKKDDYERR